jgi:hypothetical protein
MVRILQSTRNKDFFPSIKNKTKLKNPVTVGYIAIGAKYEGKLSPNIKKTLQSLRKRSFYKAVEIVSDISNIVERNFILQILYSSVTYSENNNYANLLKLWVDDIFVQKISKSNHFIDQSTKKLEDNYFFVFNLGLQYKDLPVKKEPLW